MEEPFKYTSYFCNSWKSRMVCFRARYTYRYCNETIDSKSIQETDIPVKVLKD